MLIEIKDTKFLTILIKIEDIESAVEIRHPRLGKAFRIDLEKSSFTITEDKFLILTNILRENGCLIRGLN